MKIDKKNLVYGELKLVVKASVEVDGSAMWIRYILSNSIEVDLWQANNNDISFLEEHYHKNNFGNFEGVLYELTFTVKNGVLASSESKFLKPFDKEHYND